MMTAPDALTQAVARSASVAECVIGVGVLAQAGTVYLRQFGTGPACLIADQATWQAAGTAVEAALQASGIATRRHILPALPRPKPSLDLATALSEVLAQDDATPVAIGSGEINDQIGRAHD